MTAKFAVGDLVRIIADPDEVYDTPKASRLRVTAVEGDGAMFRFRYTVVLDGVKVPDKVTRLGTEQYDYVDEEHLALVEEEVETESTIDDVTFELVHIGHSIMKQLLDRHPSLGIEEATQKAIAAAEALSVLVRK